MNERGRISQVIPMARIDTSEPSVHISHLGFDNATWTLQLNLAKLKCRREKRERACEVGEIAVISRYGKWLKVKLKALFNLVPKKKAVQKPYSTALKPPSDLTKLECHIDVPSGDIKKALNNPRPKLLRMPRLDTTLEKKRGKFTSRYNIDALESSSVESSISKTPSGKTSSLHRVLRRSKPFGQPLQLVHAERVYIPAPQGASDQRRSSFMSTDSEGQASIDSAASILSNETFIGAVLRRTSANLALASLRAGSFVTRHLRPTHTFYDEWKNEFYCDIHGRAWTEEVAADSADILKKERELEERERRRAFRKRMKLQPWAQ